MANSDGEYVDDAEMMDNRGTKPGGRATARSRPPGGGGGGTGNGKTKKSSKAAWEEVSRTWEVVEGNDGAMAATVQEVREHEMRMRLLRDTLPLHRGIIRNLVLVLDMSFAMLEKDILPNRYRVMMKYAAEFVREFFDQNPIAQLAIVAMKDGKASRVTDSSGNVEKHVESLTKWLDSDPQGDPSLQNALEMCRGILTHIPSHGTREVLVIYGALLTIDPGDIKTTIASVVEDRIRVSMIGLAGQVSICSYLCKTTNAGDDSQYTVALNKDHFYSLFLGSTTPPVARTREHANPSLLNMGFPSRTIDRPDSAVTLCACHHQPHREGYKCTRCGVKVCKLPVECPACGLTLIMSTHLARSYHHLFPLKTYREVSWHEAAARSTTACFACQQGFTDALAHVGQGSRNGFINTATTTTTATSTDVGASNDGANTRQQRQRPMKEGVSESGRYACTDCGSHFCIDCDVYAHEILHNCPGCQSLPRSLWISDPAEGGGDKGKNGDGDGKGDASENGVGGGDGEDMIIDS